VALGTYGIGATLEIRDHGMSPVELGGRTARDEPTS
jgi:hypothetical protein